jgi:tellurite methyltransferase
MNSDRIKWNQRYTERTGHHPPDTYLINMFDKLRQGKALDIAGGRGRNTFYLAEKGNEVLTVDISDVGLGVVNASAQKSQLPIQTLCLDLDVPEPLVGKGPFDSIVIINFKAGIELRNLLPALLVEGGTLLWCSFNDLQIEAFGFAPEKALFPNEFCQLSDKFELLDYSRFEDDSGHRDGYLFRKK